MTPIMSLAIDGLVKGVGMLSDSVVAGMFGEKLDDNAKDERLSSKENNEELTMETKNSNGERDNGAAVSQTISNAEPHVKQGNVMPSDKSSKFIAIRLEIFATVLANDGAMDLMEFPSADKIFMHVSGESFKKFMGGIRPVTLATDAEWRETAFCELKKTEPDAHHSTGAVWVRTKLPNPRPRQKINNKMFDYIETIVFAGKTPLEEIDYDWIAIQFGSSRQYALLYTAVANRNKIHNTPGEGKAKLGSLAHIAQETGGNDAIRDNDAEGGAETRGDRFSSGRVKFFVGVVKEKKSSLLKKTNSYLVTKASTVLAGGKKSSPCPDIPIDGGSLNDGEFVVGIYSKEPHLFFNQTASAAVQVVSWSSFKEAEKEPSAEKYLSINASGVLTVAPPFLLGNSFKPGHVIVLDGQTTYLKGFLSIGNGQVEYSDVEKYSGNFDEVVNYNQGTEFAYEENQIAILVPPPNNPYRNEGKHSVIDRDEWTPLIKSETAEQAPIKHQDEFCSNVAVGNLEQDGRTTVGAETAIAAQMENNGAASPRSGSPHSSGCGWNKEETRFLSAFSKYVRDCGFVFSDRDLVRFHTSVKTGICTLLAGDPGTGKSSIVELYARALAGKPGEQAGEHWDKAFLRVDVNPSWMEPSDLMGYMVNGEIRPAGNGLFEFLHSMREVSAVSLVCLEEMNLARVEHYFSDLIQVFSRGGGLVRGYPREGKELEIASGVRFVGTCNSDESTRPLSDRFLDRVNQLEFRLSEDDRKTLVDNAFKGIVARHKEYNEGDGVEAEQYKSWTENDGRLILPDTVGLYDAIEGKLKDVDLSPSARVLKDMAQYIAVRPMFGCDKELERQKLALDEQIAQRVLSKARATPRTITVLECIRSYCETKGLSLSAEMLGSRIGEYRHMMEFEHDA